MFQAKYSKSLFLALLIFLALPLSGLRAQVTLEVAMRGSATERDGSVHQILFETRVPSRVAQALEGTDENYPLRWIPIELTLVHFETSSRWTTQEAEYRLPYGSNRNYRGDTLRFKWVADPSKRPMDCELTRPAKRRGGVQGRFTGQCRDPHYPDPVLLELAMDPPGSQRPETPWPDLTQKPSPTNPKAPLLIRWTERLEVVWKAEATQSHGAVTFYRPELRQGFLAVGHLAQGEGNEPRLLVVRENPDSKKPHDPQHPLLTSPIDYHRLWWDRGEGTGAGWAIWQPIGALGYRCLGGVVTAGFEPPSRDEIVCLRTDLLAEGRFGDEIWKHRSRRGLLDVTLFESQSKNKFPLGTFLVEQTSKRDTRPIPRWVPHPDAVHETPDRTHGRRFVDRADGTVLDRQTGLVWLQQTDCISERNADSAARSVRSIRHGTCGLHDSSAPGDWRLPTLEEWLETQGKAERRGCSYPALTDRSGDCLLREQVPFSGDVFSARRSIKGGTSGVCWLSSTGRPNTPQVMRPGRGGWSDSHDPRTDGCVWPVRVTRKR